ncbi:MAG TPA: hypothetical protein VEK57_04280 [Thermoanaerobaculia bacterium]|nr:hypothetical protein [Thermoanaerobaculia bacterium]
MRKLVTSGWLVLLLALPSSAEGLRTIPLLRHGDIADGVGEANFAVIDITGDGKPEVITCGAGAPFAVGAVGESYGIVWRGPDVHCRAIAAGDRNRDGTPEILVISDVDIYESGESTLLVFDPRTLGPARYSVAIPETDAYDVAIGNVDFDSGMEIVVVNLDATYVYDGATLELQWEAAGYGGTRVRIGDVDGDARNEIVVNGSPGSVLDAGNEVLKWGYVGGFGYYLTLGNVDGDAKAEIVFTGSFSDEVTILNGDTFTTSTLGGYTWAIDGIAVVDADGNGVNEILTGNNQWGAIQGRNPADGTYAYQINNPDSGTQNVAAGDIDGDGSAEVFWGAGASSSGEDVLYLADPISETLEWQSVDLDGAFHSAVGDIDLDGDIEYVVATRGSNSGYAGSVIEVFDLATGASEGTLPPHPYGIQAEHVRIGQLDADPALEILVLSSSWSGVSLYTWDGVTRNPEWASGGGTGFTGATLLVRNVDADPVDEILIGSYDPKLNVLNGASNVIQWSGNITGQLLDLAAADLNGNGVDEVVLATTSGLYTLATSNWAILGEVSHSDIRAIAATSAEGGTVAVSFGFFSAGSLLSTYHGATLTPGWTCGGQDGFIQALAFGPIDGAVQLVGGDLSGTLYAFPLDDEACPEALKERVGAGAHHLYFAEVTGDDRLEIVLDNFLSSEILLAGLPSETRGDVDGDDLITGDDVDDLVDYLFDTGPGLSPAADADADRRIGVEDAFVLIHHEFAGGEAPQP